MNFYRDYRSELQSKMAKEQAQYRSWLLSCSPEEILEHTYEYTMREDILLAVEEIELTPTQASALLRSPCPLADVFKAYRDRDDGHMDVICETIEDRADALLQRSAERDSR